MSVIALIVFTTVSYAFRSARSADTLADIAEIGLISIRSRSDGGADGDKALIKPAPSQED